MEKPGQWRGGGNYGALELFIHPEKYLCLSMTQLIKGYGNEKINLKLHLSYSNKGNFQYGY